MSAEEPRARGASGVRSLVSLEFTSREVGQRSFFEIEGAESGFHDPDTASGFRIGRSRRDRGVAKPVSSFPGPKS